MTEPPQSTRPRRRGLLRWFVLALVLLPVVEIAVLILVGQAIGVWWTLGLIVVIALLGAWVAKRESGRTMIALRRAMESGRMPADEVTDAILVMTGGFLFLLPGFVSDVFALILVLPFTRPLARRLLQAVVAHRALQVVAAPAPGRSRPPGRGVVVEGEVISEQAPPTWQDHQDGPPQLDR